MGTAKVHHALGRHLARLGRLPLIYPPGERWLYHTGSDLLGVLIARTAGQPLEQFCRERIFTPLGMSATGFHVPAAKLDRLPPSKEESRIFLGDTSGWGFGLAVTTRRDDLAAPGRFGWNGGTGTSGYTDPRKELIGVLMTQRHMESSQPPGVFRDFWTAVYQAIND